MYNLNLHDPAYITTTLQDTLHVPHVVQLLAVTSLWLRYFREDVHIMLACAACQG